MSEPAGPAPTAHARSGRLVSVLGIVLASLLVGGGLLGTAYWLITFNWLLFLSLGPLIVGAFLLFTRLTGPDHA